jgi:hypothetical protein
MNEEVWWYVEASDNDHNRSNIYHNEVLWEWQDRTDTVIRRRPDRLWWGSPNLLSNGYRGLFPRQEREADHSLQTSVEVKKYGSIHPLPHTPSWRTASLIKHRGSFTFPLLFVDGQFFSEINRKSYSPVNSNYIWKSQKRNHKLWRWKESFGLGLE